MTTTTSTPSAVKIPASEFWSIVKSIGWGSKTVDYRCVQKKLALQWSPEKAEAFYEMFRSCKNSLHRVIEAWEKENNKRLDCSDDGLDDLVAHIVGLGEEEFNAVLADPKLAYVRAQKGDYQESFAYVIPDGSTLSEYTERLPKWKVRIFEDAEVVREVLPSAFPLLVEVLAMVDNAGSLNLSNKQIQERHSEIAQQVKKCNYSGSLSELDKVDAAVKFFTQWSYINYVTDMQEWAQAKRELAAE